MLAVSGPAPDNLYTTEALASELHTWGVPMRVMIGAGGVRTRVLATFTSAPPHQEEVAAERSTLRLDQPETGLEQVTVRLLPAATDVRHIGAADKCEQPHVKSL